MLSTLYLEANAINRWRGWNAAAATVSRVHGITVSGSAARQAYDRDCERYKRKMSEGKDTNAALFAVRVLTYQERIEYASEADAELVPHLREIRERYEAMKGDTDFAAARLTAKSEWLARYLSANARLDRQEEAR